MNKMRMLALSVAVAVNASALAFMHEAMVQARLHEQLAGKAPGRAVPPAPPEGHARLATRNCAAADAL